MMILMGVWLGKKGRAHASFQLRRWGLFVGWFHGNDVLEKKGFLAVMKIHGGCCSVCCTKRLCCACLAIPSCPALP